MAKSEVSAPVSSVASDRLALGVGWVRPGVAGIGGGTPSFVTHWLVGGGCVGNACFEGNEE